MLLYIEDSRLIEIPTIINETIIVALNIDGLKPANKAYNQRHSNMMMDFKTISLLKGKKKPRIKFNKP